MQKIKSGNMNTTDTNDSALDNPANGYRDYSLEGDEGVENGMGHGNSEDERLSRLMVRGREGAFTLRLHYVLREVEREGKTDIVSWLPHGRAIKIHNKELFEREILPNWFQQTKVESFHRQLNHYGFKRLERGPDKNAYYHELFLKGRPDLAQRMVRTKIKGTGPRRPTLPENEPNLWNMPCMGTLTTLGNKNSPASTAATPLPPLSPAGAVVNPMQRNQQRPQTVAPPPAMQTPSQAIPAVAADAAMIAVPMYFTPWPLTGGLFMPIFAASGLVAVPASLPRPFLPTGIIDANNTSSSQVKPDDGQVLMRATAGAFDDGGAPIQVGSLHHEGPGWYTAPPNPN